METIVKSTNYVLTGEIYGHADACPPDAWCSCIGTNNCPSDVYVI